MKTGMSDPASETTEARDTERKPRRTAHLDLDSVERQFSQIFGETGGAASAQGGEADHSSSRDGAE